MHSMQVPIGQLKVCSHQLRVELDHHLPWEEQICLFYSLGEVETLHYFLFWCLIYYEIQGRFHCHFRSNSRSLYTFFSYPNQQCLGLYIKDTTEFRRQRSSPLGNSRPPHNLLLQLKWTGGDTKWKRQISNHSNKGKATKQCTHGSSRFQISNGQRQIFDFFKRDSLALNVRGQGQAPRKVVYPILFSVSWRTLHNLFSMDCCPSLSLLFLLFSLAPLLE